MRVLWVLGLLYLTGCATHSTTVPDFFFEQAVFSADRERQTVVIDSQDYEGACAQATAVLMDLDCNLQEINSQLGVVSANSAFIRPLHGRAASSGYNWHSCAGRQVTVTVTRRTADKIAIRASFQPPDDEANETFRILLRRSLSVAEQEESRE